MRAEDQQAIKYQNITRHTKAVPQLYETGKIKLTGAVNQRSVTTKGPKFGQNKQPLTVTRII